MQFIIRVLWVCVKAGPAPCLTRLQFALCIAGPGASSLSPLPAPALAHCFTRGCHQRCVLLVVSAIAGASSLSLSSAPVHHPPCCWPWYIVLLVNVTSAILLVAVSGTGKSTSLSSAPASMHHPHDFLTGYGISSSSSLASAPNITLLVV